MSLRFPYKLLSTRLPVVPLDGRMGRPRPLIPVTLVGPAGSALELGVLDTAADDTVFPISVAARVGVDLTGAPAGSGAGVGGTAIPLRYARVTLRLATPHERREWEAWVGFTPVLRRQPLLGFAGFLQFFDALFRGSQEEVERRINGLYPGS